MDSRHGNPGVSYRYGFQGQEQDDEVKGEGNSVNYKFRMHDPRVGRFFAVDPLMAKYPHYTPYQFSGNRLIDSHELEGLEPERSADKAGLGTEEIADYNGTKYMWKAEKDGAGIAWKMQNKVEFQFGNVANSSSSYDDNKEYYPNVNVKGMKMNLFGDDNNAKDRLEDFNAAFGAGISLESLNAIKEAISLVNNFIYGQGNSLTFNSDSEMANLLMQDSDFKTYAKSFEAAALQYYRDNDGFPEGFEGDALLRNLKNPYINDTYFMNTVMGGTQQWNVEILKITASDIKVRYTVWDNFGAGVDDASSSLPGLPSLYWLQHNSGQYGVPSTYFVPFTWNINVIR